MSGVLLVRADGSYLPTKPGQEAEAGRAYAQAQAGATLRAPGTTQFPYGLNSLHIPSSYVCHCSYIMDGTKLPLTHFKTYFPGEYNQKRIVFNGQFQRKYASKFTFKTSQSGISILVTNP